MDESLGISPRTVATQWADGSTRSVGIYKSAGQSMCAQDRATDQAIARLIEVGMGTKNVVTPEIREAWKAFVDSLFPSEEPSKRE